MNESSARPTAFTRVILPICIAAALVIATLLISGSALIRIEDVYTNRILAGTYGTPDWRVQEMNPLLAQVLTLLYRLLPMVNWYGILLLALLFLSVAALISLAARRNGGLLPAALVLSPVAVLLSYSMMSTTVGALCAVAGALSLMDGLQRKKEGLGRTILGAVLFALAFSLSMAVAAPLAVCAALCALPCCIREGRWKGLLLGLPAMAILAAALFGYSALMYSSPEMAAYRSDYALYTRLQHSSLKEESDRLLSVYGTSAFSEDHASHDHDGDGVPDGEDHVHEDDVVVEPNVFDTIGWSINDAVLFFSRNGMDAELTNPETLRVLEKEARFISYDIGRLLREFFATAKKPQFLLLMALFVLAALSTVVTSRCKGLIALLAALFAFGGHLLALACYRDAFSHIAPFYLMGLSILVYHFDGPSAKAWLRRALSTVWLRAGVSVLSLAVFAAGLSGLFYYTRITPANASPFTTEVAGFITRYVQAHPEMLFIGDAPQDRVKPETLSAPVRGSDANLLAGSYDLYSPRAAALKATHGLANPLIDCVDRQDVGYVLMSFPDVILQRLALHYDTYVGFENIDTYPEYTEGIYAFKAFSEEDIAGIMEKEIAWQEVLKELEQLPEADEHDHAGEDAHEGDEHAEDGAAPSDPSPAPADAPAAAGTSAPASSAPSPASSPSAAPASNG